MKHIINRRTGRPLSLYEARALVKDVKRVYPFVLYDEHRAVNGYSLPEAAEKANLQYIKDSHYGYICVFEGTEYVTSEGYKALFIGFKELPIQFESHFTNYVVIGE